MFPFKTTTFYAPTARYIALIIVTISCFGNKSICLKLAFFSIATVAVHILSNFARQRTKESLIRIMRHSTPQPHPSRESLVADHRRSAISVAVTAPSTRRDLTNGRNSLNSSGYQKM